MKLERAFRYRSVWMGIAAIMIVVYHMQFSFHNRVVDAMFGLLYCGVDIFIFSSGIGCYYSYTKEHSPLTFYRRRIIRLAPAYFVFMCLWLPYQLLCKHMPLQAIIGNLLAIQGFTGYQHEFNWYITALVVLYCVTPYLCDFVDRYSDRYVLGLVLVILIGMIAFWGNGDSMQLVTRIPLYVIGIWFGRKGKNGDVIRPSSAVLMGLGVVIGSVTCFFFALFCKSYMRDLGLYWYPMLLITPGLCMLMSFIFESLEKAGHSWGRCKGLTAIGASSFELYLVHLYLIDIYRNQIEDLTKSTNLRKLLLLIVCMLAGMVFHWGVEKVFCSMKAKKALH